MQPAALQRERKEGGVSADVHLAGLPERRGGALHVGIKLTHNP
jgi:hypothetical protein